jgi:hypothetical protein
MLSPRLFRELLGLAFADLSRRSVGPVPREQTVDRLAAWLWEQIVTSGPPVSLDHPDVQAEQAFERLAEPFAETLRDPAVDARLVKQLGMALILDPFRVCRGSFLGAKRRSTDACDRRISGAHCVDCPFTLEFVDGPSHRAYLRGAWNAQASDCDPAWSSWLPEDWGRLRRRVDAFRRSTQAKAGSGAP